jgi:hypothetical protein
MDEANSIPAGEFTAREDALPRPEKPKPKLKWAASLRDVRTDVLRVKQGLWRYAEELDEALQFVDHMIGACDSPERDPGGFFRLPVAHSFAFRTQADGSVHVRIEAGPKFRLPPLLGAFFLHLASGEGTSDDELVPWKTREGIRLWLEAKRGEPTRQALVNHHVHLLRKALKNVSIDHRLVQSHKIKGVRLALKRTSPQMFSKIRLLLATPKQAKSGRGLNHRAGDTEDGQGEKERNQNEKQLSS